MEKKEGEGFQGGQGLPSRRESGLEEEWGVEMECVPKEFQESLESNLQQQLQEVEQRRHDLMPEHQKVQKRSHKIQCIQDKRRYLQKDSTAAEEEMRKLQEELKQKEERVLLLSNKIDKNKIQDAEMAAELRSL